MQEGYRHPQSPPPPPPDTALDTVGRSEVGTTWQPEPNFIILLCFRHSCWVSEQTNFVVWAAKSIYIIQWLTLMLLADMLIGNTHYGSNKNHCRGLSVKLGWHLGQAQINGVTDSRVSSSLMFMWSAYMSLFIFSARQEFKIIADANLLTQWSRSSSAYFAQV